MKEIQPVLTENSVEIMDSISNNRLLEFRVSNVSIFVNTSEYKDKDGVLFFVPGKKPVFWTADREEIYCTSSHGLAAQYFLCSLKSNIEN
jgi:hypothetical protein